MTSKKKTKRPKADTLEQPDVPTAPKVPYRFSDFVRVAQDDVYYGLAIHEIVKYGRGSPGNRRWALEQLRHHVEFPKHDLDDLATKERDLKDIDRCSNNTKFLMLDFCKYL